MHDLLPIKLIPARLLCAVPMAAAVGFLSPQNAAAQAYPTQRTVLVTTPTTVDFGPNVAVFDSNTPVATIQAKLDSVF